jgi:hypothetical protein
MCMEEPKNFHFSSPHDLLRKDLHFITYDVSISKNYDIGDNVAAPEW